MREMKNSIKQEPFRRVKLVTKPKFYVDSLMNTKNVFNVFRYVKSRLN